MQESQRSFLAENSSAWHLKGLMLIEKEDSVTTYKYR